MLKNFLLIFSLFFMNYAANAGQTSDINQEYFPLIRVAPQYPLRAAENKIEGYVILSFTIDTDGATKDVTVLESSHKMFERNAMKAGQKYKYRPRLVDGVAVEVNDVRVRIDFALAR